MARSAGSRRAEPAAATVRTVRVVRRHHALVRLSHWLGVPILAGLILTGLGIYWASPVLVHAPNPSTSSGSTDFFADVGIWISRHLPRWKGYANPATWFYDHFSLGPFQLASSLRLHWLLAYLFMINGALYLLGLAAGGGYRALLPRRGDAGAAARMVRYYVGFVPARLLRRAWPHPHAATKYNALQRAAYLSVPFLGALSILSGWAMHKPVQLHWLERLFGNYDVARIVHFWAMVALVAFVLPHVVLVVADGWNTLRSMVTGTWRVPGDAP